MVSKGPVSMTPDEAAQVIAAGIAANIKWGVNPNSDGTPNSVKAIQRSMAGIQRKHQGNADLVVLMQHPMSSTVTVRRIVTHTSLSNEENISLFQCIRLDDFTYLLVTTDEKILVGKVVCSSQEEVLKTCVLFGLSDTISYENFAMDEFIVGFLKGDRIIFATINTLMSTQKVECMDKISKSLFMTEMRSESMQEGAYFTTFVKFCE